MARTAGSDGTTATIATVSDAEDDDGTLVVTAKTVPSGLTVESIVNTNGTVTATVTATCTATLGANTVTLEVDGGLATMCMARAHGNAINGELANDPT